MPGHANRLSLQPPAPHAWATVFGSVGTWPEVPADVPIDLGLPSSVSASMESIDTKLGACLTRKQHAQHFSDTGQNCSCFVSVIRAWTSRRGERTKSKSDHRVDGRSRVRLHAMHVSRQLGQFSGGGRRFCARCGISQVLERDSPPFAKGTFGGLPARRHGSGARTDRASCGMALPPGPGDRPRRSSRSRASCRRPCAGGRRLFAATGHVRDRGRGSLCNFRS